MKKAELGNIVTFNNNLYGLVEKVNENSVIVDLTIMNNFRELDLDQKTVINHKNYRIVSDAELKKLLK